MKKVSILFLAVVMLFGMTACGTGKYKVKEASEAASQLEAAGYTVETIADAEAVAAYDAEGLQTVVLAALGGDFAEAPDGLDLTTYKICEIYYFETADQAKAYWTTNAFQMAHQAWSDAYYLEELRYYYSYNGTVVTAGLDETLKNCE